MLKLQKKKNKKSKFNNFNKINNLQKNVVNILSRIIKKYRIITDPIKPTFKSKHILVSFLLAKLFENDNTIQYCYGITNSQEAERRPLEIRGAL